jgi:pimeloyl-ACP methyl ester carboxylesterase
MSSPSAIRRPDTVAMLAVLRYPVRTFWRFCWPEPGSDFERPEDYGLLPEPFETVTDDGLCIRGWTFVPDQPWGVVVVCHARSASKSRTLRQAKLLHERGLAVATFDFRACGDSDRPARARWNSLWEPLRDLDAVARYVEHRFTGDILPANRVVLLGCSFGGNMALAHAGTAQREYPALILDSTPLVRWGTVLDAQLERERRTARFRRARAVADRLVVRAVVAWTKANALYRHARRSAQSLRETSVLLIVGERDVLFDIEESRRFLGTHYAGNQQVWQVPQGRHLTNHVVEPGPYADRIVDLLAEAFRQADRRACRAGPAAAMSIATSRSAAP